MVPISGTCSGTHFSGLPLVPPKGSRACPAQGFRRGPKNGYQKWFRIEPRLVWQWWYHLESLIRAKGKRVLNVNLDETGVPILQTTTKGNVVAAPLSEATTVRPALATSRDCARANFTHVALICDDAATQPLLPQLIIVGERVARARDMPTLRASFQANAYLMRLKRGWTNCVVHQMVVALLRDALAHIRDEYEVILSMDACKVHRTL